MVQVRDVAARAGVSIATASRVLSQADYPVRAATRDRVLAAAAELGYRPNALARSLRQGTTSAVGVCATSLSSLTSMSVVEGIAESLEGYGRYTQVAMTRWDPDRERAALELFLAERVAGVLSFPTQLESDGYLQLQDAGIPVVLINRAIPGVAAPLARHDFAGGYRQVVETLAAAGHRRIVAVLTSHHEGPEPAIRPEHQIAWTAALERVGLVARPDWQVPAGESVDVANLRAALTRILDDPAPPSGLFCGDLPATLALVQIVNDMGLRVPDDIAMMGTTDRRWRDLLPTRMPVMLLDSHKLGTAAAELVAEAITLRQVGGDREIVAGVSIAGQLGGSDRSGAARVSRRTRKSRSR